MIQNVAPGPYRDTLPLTDFLVGDDLAWVGQAFTLRVTGLSMYPALREGDVLRILPPNSLDVGDLVLFRHERALVCHRVIDTLADDMVRTRGDDVRGDGELVRRADLVGKVADIVRGETSLDPRSPQAATVNARIGRMVGRATSAVRFRLVDAASRILRLFLGSSPGRPIVRLVLRRFVSYAVGVPASVQFVRAYRFVELGRRPIDPDYVRSALQSLPSLQEAILLARLGRVPLGTMAVSSGEVQIRQAGVGLGIDENLLATARELVALESAGAG